MKNFFSQKLYVFAFVCVLLLAIAVSGYRLGSVPHGVTWDEAAIGYNGYAIFTTRRDEWLTKLPVSFRSFGDYKAPLAIYVNGVSTAIFGLNAIGIRLPFTIASILSVAGLMLLIELLWRGQKQAYLYSISAGIIMVTSPWYVHYSRAGFESGIALFFTIWAAYFFLIFRKYRASLAIVMSSLFFALSLYTYHSSKVVAPIMVLFLLYFAKKEIFNKSALIKLLGAGIGALILCYFLLKDAITGEGLQRAGVTLFSQYSFWEAISLSVGQFGTHLLPSFLISGATTTLRHGDGHWGVLLLPTYLLVLISIFLFIPKLRANYSLEKFIFGLAWIVIGIAPAAIATEVPHSNRALLALPGFIILTIVTIDWLTQKYSKELFKRLLIGTLIMLQSIFFVAYIQDYFTVFASQSATDFKDGYIEAFEITHRYELGTEATPQVSKIIVASKYGQPYIYALLVRKTNPIVYQHGSLLRYEFRDTISDSDLDVANALIVAMPGDITSIDPFHTIYGSDGQPKFEMFLTASD